MNQAFEYNGRVIGLQFNLEPSNESVYRLIQHCQDELIKSKYIQRPEEMLYQHSYLQEINKTINLLLNNIDSTLRETETPHHRFTKPTSSGSSYLKHFCQ
jgi:hypothetical protein